MRFGRQIFIYVLWFVTTLIGLELTVLNYDLYLNRRQEQSLEVPKVLNKETLMALLLQNLNENAWRDSNSIVTYSVFIILDFLLIKEKYVNLFLILLWFSLIS